jgi:hypothetical protein
MSSARRISPVRTIAAAVQALLASPASAQQPPQTLYEKHFYAKGSCDRSTDVATFWRRA